MKIYFAGPDVFRPDYQDFMAKIKKICENLKIFGLYPGETFLNDPKDIYLLNIELIGKADIILANLNPFRGLEPDSGTVFECGLAKGLGKEVYCYLSDRRDLLRQIKSLPSDSPEKRLLAQDDSAVEDFGFSVNLMLAFAVKKLYKNIEEALLDLSLQ
jgi:nucleoside 2-deoxyribosyltransferase